MDLENLRNSKKALRLEHSEHDRMVEDKAIRQNMQGMVEDGETWGFILIVTGGHWRFWTGEWQELLNV